MQQLQMKTKVKLGRRKNEITDRREIVEPELKQVPNGRNPRLSFRIKKEVKEKRTRSLHETRRKT